MTKFGNTDTILVQILYSYMGLDECTVMFMKKMLKLSVTFEPKTLQILMPILQTLTKIIEISGNTETFSNVSPNQMLLFLNDQ